MISLSHLELDAAQCGIGVIQVATSFIIFYFSEISQSSCEILFEVWDQGQKIGKSDAFMGLAIVSVSELLATASQRHVVPLQGRPYEEDKVGPLGRNNPFLIL